MLRVLSFTLDPTLVLRLWGGGGFEALGFNLRTIWNTLPDKPIETGSCLTEGYRLYKDSVKDPFHKASVRQQGLGPRDL